MRLDNQLTDEFVYNQLVWMILGLKCVKLSHFSIINYLRLCLDGGVEKWEDGKLWEDGKYLVFPLMCLVGGVEKWDDGKLFCLVGEKKRRMENVIYVN